MAVTGLVGRIRGRQAPPSDDPMAQAGNIRWVISGYGVNFRVDAFDHVDAVKKGIRKVKNPQEINEVYPQNRQYRR